jgi:CubicO group peptidase (beta-lactamase class C family)
MATDTLKASKGHGSLRRQVLGAGISSFALGAVLPVWAQHQRLVMSGEARPLLDAQLEQIVADPSLPLASLSVLAIKDRQVSYHRQFGRRFIAPADSGLLDRPADPQTTYRIASISKLVTAIITMRLVEAGQLDLDRDIGEIIGLGVRNPHFPAVPITVRHLLTHTSSLRDDGGYYWEAKLGVNIWRDVLTPGGREYGNGAMWSRDAAPGRYFQYNNFAWGVLGGVLEKASGMRFDGLAERELFTPLGIVGSFNPASLKATELNQVATLYRKRREVNGREVWRPDGPWVAQVDDYSRAQPASRFSEGYELGTNGTLCGPQGNCRLSAEGLGVIMLMLMNGGETANGRFLKAATVAALLMRAWTFTPAGKGLPANGQPNFGSHQALMNAWGLGNQHFLDISGPKGGDRLVQGGGLTGVGHIGDAWGLTSAFVMNRERRCGFIYLIGGPGDDPEKHPGRYSAFYRHEEAVMTALYRGAVV